MWNFAQILVKSIIVGACSILQWKTNKQKGKKIKKMGYMTSWTY